MEYVVISYALFAFILFVLIAAPLGKRVDEKERRLLRATLSLQDRFGKNAVLKGMNFIEGGTTIERNQQIGGHKA